MLIYKLKKLKVVVNELNKYFYENYLILYEKEYTYSIYLKSNLNYTINTKNSKMIKMIKMIKIIKIIKISKIILELL